MQLKFVQLGLSMLALATPSLAAAVPTLTVNTTSEAPVTPTARPGFLPTKPFFPSAGLAWTREKFKGKKYTLSSREECLSVDDLWHSGPGYGYLRESDDNDDEGSDHQPPQDERSVNDKVSGYIHPGHTPSRLSFESFKVNRGAKCTVFLNSKCRKNVKVKWPQWLKLKIRKAWKELKPGKYADTGKFGPIKSVSCTSTLQWPNWPTIHTMSVFNSTMLAI